MPAPNNRVCVVMKSFVAEQRQRKYSWYRQIIPGHLRL